MLDGIIKILQCLACLSTITINGYSLVDRIKKITVLETQAAQIDSSELREIVKEVEQQIATLDEEIKTIKGNLLNNHQVIEEELFLPTRPPENHLPKRLKKWLKANDWEVINNDFLEEKFLVVDQELTSKEKLRDEWNKLLGELNVKLNN